MAGLDFCKRWASHLAEQNQLSSEREAEMAFALELLVINLANLLLTLALGWLLGVFTLTLLCIAVVTLFRHTAGGAHSSSPWRCAFFTIILFPLLALLARHLSRFPPEILQVLVIGGSVISILLLYLYSPYETEQAPILSSRRRKQLRTLSFVVFLLIGISMLLLSQSTWTNALQYQMCLLLGMTWAAINLTPAARRFWLGIDRITFTRPGKEVKKA